MNDTKLFTVDPSGNTNSTGNLYEKGNRVCTATNGLCSGGPSGYQSGAAGWTNTSTVTSTMMNVAIGKPSTAANLEVSNPSGNGELDITGASWDHALLVLNPGTGSAFGNAAIEVGVWAAPLYLTTQTGTIFLNPGSGGITIAGANGYVGVGTASPTQALDVNGSINISASNQCLIVGSTWNVCGNSTDLIIRNSTGGVRVSVNTTCSSLLGTSGSIVSAC